MSLQNSGRIFSAVAAVAVAARNPWQDVVEMMSPVLLLVSIVFQVSGFLQFLREELHYTGGHERRQKSFHRNDDMHISVLELWDIWTRSEVHNWTVEQTTVCMERKIIHQLA